MGKLLDQLAVHDRQREADRRKALKTYSAILARQDQPKSTDAAELLAAMATLGISHAEMEADAAAVAAVAAAEKKLVSEDQLEVLRHCLAAAVNGMKAAEAEWAERERSLQVKTNEALAALRRAEMGHEGAERTIQREKAAHPFAFGEEPAAPAPQQEGVRVATPHLGNQAPPITNHRGETQEEENRRLNAQQAFWRGGTPKPVGVD